jgi:uncharacterized protein
MQALWLILLGSTAGYLSGVAGIGGGIILVPGLVFLLGMTQQTAQGTTLAMLLLPIGALAVWTYWQKGHVDWSVAALLGLGYVGGSYLGARMAMTLSTTDLKRIFATLLVIVAIKLFWER